MRAMMVFLLMGCSAAPSEGPHGPCAQRSGAYTIHFVERSGTCGQVPDSVTVMGGQSSARATSQCAGGAAFSADGCEATLDITCPAGDGRAVTERGTATWSPDGESASGLIYIEVDNGNVAECTGMYDVSFTKQ